MDVARIVCSLPKTYKCMPVMGVNIRRVIFPVLERIGIVLGIWVNQSYHSLGRRGASLVEFPAQSLDVSCSPLQTGYQGPTMSYQFACIALFSWSWDTKQQGDLNSAASWATCERNALFHFIFEGCIKLTAFCWLTWRAVFLRVCCQL